MKWQVIDSGLLPATEIMLKDACLLAQLTAEQAPILHLYDWQGPSLTYGYFTSPAYHLHLEQLAIDHVQIARRPTGGGITFHLTDLAFSILIPAAHPLFSYNTLENYARINERLICLIKKWTNDQLQPTLFRPLDCQETTCYSFCMAKPTPYDVMMNGKKIAGAAQRRTKQGFLHQGSLFLLPLSDVFLQSILKQPQEIISAIQEQSFYLFNHLEVNSLMFQEKRQALKQSLIQSMTQEI